MYFTEGRTDHTQMRPTGDTSLTQTEATSEMETARTSVEPADHGSVEVLAMAAVE